MTVVGKCVHRCTHVLDLEKTLAFYEKALGITETRRKDLKMVHGSSFLRLTRKARLSWSLLGTKA